MSKIDCVVDAVIDQIRLDLANEDLTALEELLKRVNVQVLQSYLPEVEYVTITKSDGFYCGE